MQKWIRTIGVLAFATVAVASQATTVTLVDASTQGLYNQGIGTLLDNSSSAFPVSPSDPVQTFAVAPNLAAAAVPLGNWLSTPATPGGNWSGPQLIPTNWAVDTETAIIYSFDAGATGMHIDAQFGVDNGIFVWLDGVFMGGQMQPGGATLGEFNFQTSVAAGTHYLQVLREDHGGATGYSVRVNGTVPEPASLAIVALALLAAGAASRRRA